MIAKKRAGGEPTQKKNVETLGAIIHQGFGQLIDALSQKLQFPFDPNQQIQGHCNGKAQIAHQVE